MAKIVIRNSIRRGSVYLIVLATSMMVTVIGLASLFAVRVQRRSVEIANDCSEALLCAQSAVELGLLSVQDPNWRYNQSNGIWLSSQPLGSGLLTLEGIDPYDSVLNDSNMDPLVLIGTGEKGFARQKMQVSLVAEVSGLSCLEVALHAQNDVSFNSATVNCDQTISANNSISAISSTINSDTEAPNTINGGTYNGTTMFPVPAKEMPDSTVLTCSAFARLGLRTRSSGESAQIASNISRTFGLVSAGTQRMRWPPDVLNISGRTAPCPISFRAKWVSSDSAMARS